MQFHSAMNKLLKIIGLFAILFVMPARHFGQITQYTQNQSTIFFKITDISLFDERVFFMYNLVNDSRFNVVNSEDDGVFIISADPAFEGMDLQTAFADFQRQNAMAFSRMDKEQATETAIEYKTSLPKEITHSLMMDVYIKSRQNNLCANADPFCTDNGLYEFPAGVNAGYGESGPNYACLSSQPNPAWYYMRIGNPGSINIYMYSTPGEDIDFCCWGPFDDPISPCPGGLTLNKKVSCSYSADPTETCVIPSSAQTGEYYILVITNYSNHSCNITFSKTSGSGTTDCSIMPPLVENGGPYCVGETIQLSGNAQQDATYSWSGPGGWVANGQNVSIPNCTLAMAGTYTCTIRVGTQTNSATTDVAVYAKPTASFNASSVCEGNPTRFTNTSTTNPANQAMIYLWEFGDGNTSDQQNPSHQYAAAGNYNATLTVKCGDDACTSTRTQSVTVYPTPKADAGDDQTTQYGGTVQLHGSGGAGTFSYHWEPANKVVNPNAQNTQTVALNESTTFTLTVTHPQGGCSDSDQTTVLISGSNMTATANATPNKICVGESTQLRASAVGGSGNYTYSWSPTIGLSNPLIANPTAHPTETTTYTCTVSDGYSTQNVTVTVTVNSPEFEEETHYICPGDSYNFYGTTYTEAGNYDYVTTTSQGCEKTITLHLLHYPSYPNANTTTEYICPGTSYNFHGHYYSVPGTYSENLHTTLGCDSIVWLDLHVYPANDTTIVDPTICNTQTYNFHGTEYSEDGTVAYFDTIDNHGCLKVEKLILTVGDYQMPPKETPRICYAHNETPSYYWDKTGLTYTQDTYDEIILPDPNGGCDIKHRLDLKFHQEFYDKQTLTVCDEYVWPVNNMRYTTTNHNIIKTFHDVGGPGFSCDSTYVLDLTVNYSDESEINTTACNEYIWDFGWNNESYTITESGSYTKTIETTLGCDSIVTLNIQMDYSPTFPRVEGKSWVVGGGEFQYTIEDYWIETSGTHLTEWQLKDKNGNDFKKWELKPYGDNYDRCLVYIYTYELDTVELCATTTNTGSGNTICGDSDTKSKWIHCSSYSTPETEQRSVVDVYPNPNDGYMTLSFENMPGNVDVKVYDITGTLMDSFAVNNGYEKQTHQYHAKQLSKGVYYIRFACQVGVVTKKVIILD
jgi:PKD repeat protein